MSKMTLRLAARMQDGSSLTVAASPLQPDRLTAWPVLALTVVARYDAEDADQSGPGAGDTIYLRPNQAFLLENADLDDELEFTATVEAGLAVLPAVLPTLLPQFERFGQLLDQAVTRWPTLPKVERTKFAALARQYQTGELSLEILQREQLRLVRLADKPNLAKFKQVQGKQRRWLAGRVELLEAARQEVWVASDATDFVVDHGDYEDWPETLPGDEIVSDQTDDHGFRFMRVKRDVVIDNRGTLTEWFERWLNGAREIKRVRDDHWAAEGKVD